MPFTDPPRRKTVSRHRIIFPLAALAILLAITILPAPAASAAQEEGGGAPAWVDPDTLNLGDSQLDPDAPDLDYVWENDYEVEGVTYKGFMRLRSMPGFVWQGGHFSNAGWVPPHWVPTRNRVDFIWARGHRGPDGYWVLGHWRPVQRPDYVWVEGRDAGGAFIAGYWRPVHPRSGYIWVPGHPTPAGGWVSGFWRPRGQADFVWVRGRYRYGYWKPGYWRPTHPRDGFVWVGGYYGPGSVWIDGYWRPVERPGYYWVAPYWRGGVWVTGSWVAGRRPHVVRRHRVYRVPAIRTHRRVRSRPVYRHPPSPRVRENRREDRRLQQERRQDQREDRRRRRQDRR